MFRLPRRIKRRRDTDGLRLQKGASAAGFPQQLLSRLGGGGGCPQSHSSPSKIKAIFVCLAMSAFVTTLYGFGGVALDWPQPYLMPWTWLGCSQSTPSHPGALGRIQSVLSRMAPGYEPELSQWGQEGGSLHRHILIAAKTLIEMSRECRVAIPHPQPKLAGLGIRACKVSFHPP